MGCFGLASWGEFSEIISFSFNKILQERRTKKKGLSKLRLIV